MIINFSPVRLSEPLILDVDGDLIYVNGEVFDLSPLLEGATLPASAITPDCFRGELTRIDGEIHLTLVLPHGANAPEETRFPQPIHVTEDGSVDLPPFDIEVQDEQYRLEPNGDVGDETGPGAGEPEETGIPGTPEPETGS